MREIKFRAWDQLRQEMYESDGISYGVREDFDDMVSFRFAHTENIDGDLSKERVLEQYTGLEDKNGVEIYEGDIVKVLDAGDIEDTYYSYLAIVYSQGSFRFENANSVTFDDVLYGDLLDVEVAGNIHENAYLLE